MPFIRHSLVPAVLAAVLLAAPAVWAQGYEGLFADDAGKAAPRVRDGAQPPGYQGLIPGAVPQAVPAPAPAPQAAGTQQPQAPADTTRLRPLRVGPGAGETTAAAPAATPAPLAALGMTPIRTSDDLRRLALIYSVDKNFDKIPDSMAAQFRLPETSIAFLQQPRARIKGMLPMERSVKRSIDAALEPIKNQQMPAAERQARIKNAIDSLKTIRLGLQAQSMTPASTYKVMGLPDIYIKEEREGTAKALQHVDAALKQLQGQ